MLERVIAKGNSVCQSVRYSHSGFTSKRFKISEYFSHLHRQVAPLL